MIKDRHRSLFIIGGFIILLLAYYLFFLSPGLAEKEKLNDLISKRESDLVKMSELKREWDQFTQDRIEAEKLFSRRGRSFTLLSFLEGLSREVGIQRSIQYMKPIGESEKSGPLKIMGMEVKLEDISNDQLLNFLYKLEYSDNLIHIKRIKIDKFSKKETESLRVTLQVVTYIKA